MELNLAGKKAIVTGSSRGIGLSIAKELLAEGCSVLLNARDESCLSSACHKIQGDAQYFASDVTSLEGAKGLVEHAIKIWGKIDLLVTNVGNGTSVPVGHESHDEFKRIFDINFFSASNVLEHALPFLKTSRGNIVCISSICGLRALGAPATYSAAKAALNSYIINISKVLGREGVRINAVAPGNILFEGSVWDRKLTEDKRAVFNMLEHNVSLNRLGKPEEIASVVSFLLSEKAAFITGSIIVADGGQIR